MIGLVLITHGEIGTALAAAAEHVVGVQQQLRTLSIGADDDIQARRRDLEHAVDAVDHGDGVVVLTDMFGSTPSNLAVALLERAGVEVIAGVNLPMLVKLAKIRSDRTLAECVGIAELVGRKYIAAASGLPKDCLGGAACCQMGKQADTALQAVKPAPQASRPEPVLHGVLPGMAERHAPVLAR